MKRPPVVVYQGEPGAFSEAALLALLGDGAQPEPKRAFDEVVGAVVSGDAALGLLPVENSLAGVVAPVWDLLGDSPLRVVGETVLPIRLALLALREMDPAGLRRALSHPVALEQCRQFLRRHPRIEPVAVHDTAGAARLVAERGDEEMAAIASTHAAKRYGLVPLEHDIQDRTDNRTRFFLVGRPDEPVPRLHGSTAQSKTALVVEVGDRPGALLDVLEPFARAGINLTHLQSRPAGAPWTYRFYLEVAADAGAPPASEVIREVMRRSQRVRIMGSFLAAGPVRDEGQSES